MKLAAPNAALRQHGAYYEARLKEAIYKDLQAEERPSLDFQLTEDAVRLSAEEREDEQGEEGSA